MRRVIGILLVLALAAGLSVGCAQTSPSPTVTTTVRPTTPAATPAASPSPRPSATPATTPQYGGTLRIIRRYTPRSLYPAGPLGASGHEGPFESLIDRN